MSVGHIVKGSLNNCIKLIPEISFLQNNFYPVLLIPIHFFMFLPFASVPFIIWVCESLKQIKTINAKYIIIGGLGIAGIPLTYLMKADGYSEGYFISASVPFIEICALLWIKNHFPCLKLWMKSFLVITLILSLLSGVCKFVNYSGFGFFTITKTFDSQYFEKLPVTDGLTYYEYSALDWLSKNSDENSIIATDRHFIVEFNENKGIPFSLSLYFYHSVFSKRQMFLEGWSYTARTNEMRNNNIERFYINESFYDNSCANREYNLSKFSIDYIIVSNFIHPNLSLSCSYLKEVFHNRDIVIYKVKEKTSTEN